jgi:hypothetical protein
MLKLPIEGVSREMQYIMSKCRWLEKVIGGNLNANIPISAEEK